MMRGVTRRIAATLALAGVARGLNGGVTTAVLRPVLDAVLASPLNEAVLVPMARRMMIETAEANEVPWSASLAWIRARCRLEEEANGGGIDEEDAAYPAYYRAPFHAYARGNLCWEAAFEQEIASAAVGARNYPAHGRDGEAAFRGAFDDAFDRLGARVQHGGLVVDLGCGTGASTRRLATRFARDAGQVVGVDLSPYFLAVARTLLNVAAEETTTTNASSSSTGCSSSWVGPLFEWDRLLGGTAERTPPKDAVVNLIDFVRADAARLPFADASVDVCQLSLVVHELPPAATRDVLREAARVLRPGGQLWLCEMDFDTPGFRDLRANPLLFSFIRSTEPFLDVYADYNARGLVDDLVDLDAFAEVRLCAATGRHFALVADKRSPSDASNNGATRVDDRRAETAMPDTHLRTWATSSE